MTQNKTLSRNRRRALAALLTAPSITAAAESCGLARGTLHRYIAEPAFQLALAAAQADLLASAGRRLASELARSVDVMAELRDGGDTPAAVRLRAAASIIDGALKMHEPGGPPVDVASLTVSQLNALIVGGR